MLNAVLDGMSAIVNYSRLGYDFFTAPAFMILGLDMENRNGFDGAGQVDLHRDYVKNLLDWGKSDVAKMKEWFEQWKDDELAFVSDPLTIRNAYNVFS